MMILYLHLRIIKFFITYFGYLFLTINAISKLFANDNYEKLKL